VAGKQAQQDGGDGGDEIASRRRRFDDVFECDILRDGAGVRASRVV
jgi:hypothetical protein